MSNSIGDLNNSGLKGNNWPWQYRVLLGLDGILSALQNNDEDIEVAYVIEKCPGPPATERVLLEVRVWDASSNTWGTIGYYLPGSNTPLPAPVPAPGCTLEYVGANDIRPLTCADQITVCGTSFTTILGNSALNVNVVNPIPLEVLINQANDSILVYGFDGTVNQPISVTSGGAVNIRPLTCTDKVSLCFNDGVSDVTVSSANPLPVNATVTIPNPLPVSQDATSNPWTVDGTVNVGNFPTSFEVSNDVGNPLPVSGTVAATQSGTWNITNITGSVSLPTGAATETTLALVNSNTVLGNLTLNAIDTKLTPATRTHNTIVATTGPTAIGSVPISLRGSVMNVGSAPGIWNGISLPAGVAIPWDAVGPRDTYGTIAYDATGTTFIIEYTT